MRKKKRIYKKVFFDGKWNDYYTILTSAEAIKWKLAHPDYDIVDLSIAENDSLTVRYTIRKKEISHANKD